ncbi:MAG: OsmC family protein [Prolixibacteraceae bacterium]|nr:OsmC family protein [Prolixibacteraceae bacterium]
MKTRNAHALWKGNLKHGTGTLKLDSLEREFQYNFVSRFEEGEFTNPEELIAAAHAGCFSQAFSMLLTEKGFEPVSISTTAKVKLVKVEDGFRISESFLVTEADVPGIEENLFQEIAHIAKTNCPVSQALSSIDIKMEASLIQ